MKLYIDDSVVIPINNILYIYRVNEVKISVYLIGGSNLLIESNSKENSDRTLQAFIKLM